MYREIKRRAKKGELVKVIRATETYAVNKTGGIYEVFEENGETCEGMVREHCVVIVYGQRCCLYHDQYVVLEPVFHPREIILNLDHYIDREHVVVALANAGYTISSKQNEKELYKKYRPFQVTIHNYQSEDK